MGTLASILWFIIVLAVVLWVVGLVVHVAGSLIHILLVVALVLIVYNLFVGSRSSRL